MSGRFLGLNQNLAIKLNDTTSRPWCDSNAQPCDQDSDASHCFTVHQFIFGYILLKQTLTLINQTSFLWIIVNQNSHDQR